MIGPPASFWLGLVESCGIFHSENFPLPSPVFSVQNWFVQDSYLSPGETHDTAFPKFSFPGLSPEAHLRVFQWQPVGRGHSACS
jgi:hypothetical protein